MLLPSHLPRVSRVGRRADSVAGGFMGGIGGFVGMAKDEQRAFFQNFNLAALACTMLGDVIAGTVTREMWPLLPLVAVALLVPSLLAMLVAAVPRSLAA